jgi:hypothetical protein
MAAVIVGTSAVALVLMTAARKSLGSVSYS